MIKYETARSISVGLITSGIFLIIWGALEECDKKASEKETLADDIKAIPDAADDEEKADTETAEVEFNGYDVSDLTDYTSYADAYKIPKNEKPAEIILGMPNDGHMEGADDMEMKEITQEEFMEGWEDYDKETFTYYIADDVLAGPNDSLDSNDIESTVGRKWLDKFKEDPDLDVIYLVDGIEHCCLEIIVSNGCYEEDLQDLKWDEEFAADSYLSD